MLARQPALLDLAVLCCLPLEQSEWLSRGGLAPPRGDFVRFCGMTVGEGDLMAAWNVFEREATFLRRKFDGMARAGIFVCLQATAEDIRNAARHHRNVAVFAHWKGPELLPDDPPECCDRLETWDDMITADAMASLFPEEWTGTVFLAVCTSVRPAEAFRRRLPESICVCSRDRVNAGLSMARLDAARRLMAADQNLPLWKALVQSSEMIDQLGRRS